MRQIRFGLEEGLDVSLYNSKQFDWFQMEEIRLGLKDGIDAAVSILWLRGLLRVQGLNVEAVCF